jgi:RNA polymerase sigma factor (sigma-70 family)
MEALVNRRVGCRATAADLVQDLFVRFWRRPLGAGRRTQHLSAALCAGNIAIDHLRNEGTRARLNEGLVPDERSSAWSEPQAALEASNDLRHVEAALRGLPEKTRQIFLLNRIHGRKYGDIAKAMGFRKAPWKNI